MFEGGVTVMLETHALCLLGLECVFFFLVSLIADCNSNLMHTFLGILVMSAD